MHSSSLRRQSLSRATDTSQRDCWHPPLPLSSSFPFPFPACSCNANRISLATTQSIFSASPRCLLLFVISCSTLDCLFAQPPLPLYPPPLTPSTGCLRATSLCPSAFCAPRRASLCFQVPVNSLPHLPVLLLLSSPLPLHVSITRLTSSGMKLNKLTRHTTRPLSNTQAPLASASLPAPFSLYYSSPSSTPSPISGKDFFMWKCTAQSQQLPHPLLPSPTPPFHAGNSFTAFGSNSIDDF